MIELILLAGLVALFVAQRKTAARVDALEEALRTLTAADAAAVPTPERVPDPVAAQVRTVPPRQPEPLVPKEAPPPPAPPRPVPEEESVAGLFERLVGGRLLIWIGGIALAVAGVFLVRYSIEIGLITPALRMIAAGLFGLMLIGAGEAARLRVGAAGDVRIGQAMVGAGLLVLYATSYGSIALYGLIGLGTATALMALITIAALLLSLRHGEPTAAMGLIGGFLTPLLVGDPESSAVPLLAYLGLLNIALYALAQRQGWTWLAAGAALLSFLWTGGLLLAPPGDALAAGLFIFVLSLAASLVRPGSGRLLRLLRPAAIGLLQLSVLVARSDLDLSAWLLFGMLAAAGLWLSVRSAEYRLLPIAALLLALVLLAGEAAGGSGFTLAVAASITLLFGGFGWWRMAGEDRLLASATAAVALAGPATILRLVQEPLLPTAAWAVLLVALGGAGAALVWRERGRAVEHWPADMALLALSVGTAALLLLSAYDLVPLILIPAAWIAIAIGFAVAARRISDSALAATALGVALIGMIRALPLADGLWQTALLSLTGDPALASDLPPALHGAVVLGLPGALLALVARTIPDAVRRARRLLWTAAGLFAAATAYLLLKRLFGLSGGDDFVARGFAERTLITQAIFAAGWLLARRGRTRAAALLTATAAARLVWFDLIVHNPVLNSQSVGAWPVVNLLLPAFLGGAAWLYAARRRTADAGMSGIWLSLSLLSLVAGAMLMVRQGFQGAILARAELPLPEFYGYSLVGLLLAAAIILAGVKLPDKALRAAGLAFLTATIVKVFVVDAGALEGLLRILSFLGLGVALIALGTFYGTVLNREARTRAGE